MPILVVADDVDLANALVHALAKEGLAGEAVHDGDAAIQKLQKKRFSVVLLDLLLPKISGANVVDFLKDKPARPKVIIMTDADASTFSKLDRSVVRTILFKPLSAQQVASYISRAAFG